MDSARKASGWGDGLPAYVKCRMEDLDVKPTLRTLAKMSEVTAITLFRNFRGERPMHLETAKRLSKALQVSLDELASQNLIVEE